MPTKPTKKEEKAAALRRLLNTDVKFERLSMEDLDKLTIAIRNFGDQLVTEFATATQEQPRVEGSGPLGFGVMPALSKAFQQAVAEVSPRIRSRIKELIDEALQSGYKHE